MGVWDYIKNSGDIPTAQLGHGLGRHDARQAREPPADRRPRADATRPDGRPATSTTPWRSAAGRWTSIRPAASTGPTCRPAVQIRTPESTTSRCGRSTAATSRNLMMAGRNISASHVAFTSTRVMATCAVIGQAAGTAAALCGPRRYRPAAALSGQSPLERAGSKRCCATTRRSTGGATRIAQDLARQAKATASGEADDFKAELVLDGYVRDIPGGAVHRWSTELSADGAWLELAWEQPHKDRPGADHLRHRLPARADAHVAGRDQQQDHPRAAARNGPRLRIGVSQDRPAGPWQKLATVTGNYQRLVRHRFEPVEAQACV